MIPSISKMGDKIPSINPAFAISFPFLSSAVVLFTPRTPVIIAVILKEGNQINICHITIHIIRPHPPVVIAKKISWVPATMLIIPVIIEIIESRLIRELNLDIDEANREPGRPPRL